VRPALAARWRPGLPAFDLLVERGFVVLCAWCGRARTRQGEWRPGQDLAVVAHPDECSHGICPACVEWVAG